MLSTFRSVEYSSQLYPHKPAEIKSIISRAVLENNNALLARTAPMSTHSLLDYTLTKFQYIQLFLAL